MKGISEGIQPSFANFDDASGDADDNGAFGCDIGKYGCSGTDSDSRCNGHAMGDIGSDTDEYPVADRDIAGNVRARADRHE